MNLNVLNFLLLIITPALGVIENEEPCHSRGGSCVFASDCKEAASIQCGWCPSQPASIRCCLAYQEAACSASGGLCKRNDSSCMGQYTKGKCATQQKNIECCLEGGNGDDNFQYDYATGCSNGPQPGANCLLKYMQRNSPSGHSMGIFNCRHIAGSQQYSLHAEGRALDWGLNVSDSAQKAEADKFIRDVLAFDAKLAKRMGIQELIFNRRIWTTNYPDDGMRPYNGENPHTDHIHIGLNWKGALNETSFWKNYPC